MTDQSATPADPDPRLEVLQAVVDRVTSWQEHATEETVSKELDEALAKAGVELDEAARRRVVDRVSNDGSHFDVREVL